MFCPSFHRVPEGQAVSVAFPWPSFPFWGSLDRAEIRVYHEAWKNIELLRTGRRGFSVKRFPTHTLRDPLGAYATWGYPHLTLHKEVSMGQNDLPPTIPPPDFLKEYWQYLLKDLWPVILPQLLTSGGHGLPGEIRGQLLKGILPGILPQITLPKGGESGPPSVSSFEGAWERAPEQRKPITREEMARLLAKDEGTPGRGSESLQDPASPEPREKTSPEPEKPVPRDKVIPLRKEARGKHEEPPPVPRSVGRKFKLRWIDSSFWESRAFEGLALGARELYRILLTFSKRPGGGSRYRYCQIGIEQARGLLDRRKEDLLRTKRGERRKEALGIGITERSVRRYLEALKKRGLIIQVVRGRPSDPARDTSPYVSKYLVVVSERQRFKLTLDRKKGLGPRSRRSRRRPETLP